MKSLDDKELIVSYINGNHEAFETLLMRHKRRIYNLIYVKIKDRDIADDLFQDTFIKIINTFNIGNYNEEGKFLPWAMRIAHNLVIDHFRKGNKMKFVSETPSKTSDFNIFSILASDSPNKLQEMSHEELMQQLVDLVEELPTSQRDMIHLRIFEELSFKEIAEREDISINTALGRMRYALLNMRKLVEKHQLVTDLA